MIFFFFLNIFSCEVDDHFITLKITKEEEEEESIIK